MSTQHPERYRCYDLNSTTDVNLLSFAEKNQSTRFSTAAYKCQISCFREMNGRHVQRACGTFQYRICLIHDGVF